MTNQELYLEWCNNWQSLEDFSIHFSLHINFARQLIISEGLQRSSILNRDNLPQRVLVSAQPMPEFVREPLKKDIAFLAEKAASEEALDFPDFARHQIALKCNSMRGVYDQQTIHRRIQNRSGKASH